MTKREYKSYLNRFSEVVYQERKKLKMNQIDFYKFLFPNTDKQDENIKKKMNAIENSKISTVDYEFIFTLCNVCNISMDYLFDNKTTYRNHKTEFICDYTGLDEDTIEILHEFKTAKESDVRLSIIKDGGVGDEADRIEEAINKNTAINMLTIINYLFKYRPNSDYPDINEGKLDESNLSILYHLYQYCIGQPETLCGVVTGKYALEIDPMDKAERIPVEINLNEATLLKDKEDTYYPFNSREVYREIAKNNLIKSLEKLAKQYEHDTGITFEGDSAFKELVSISNKRRNKR